VKATHGNRVAVVTGAGGTLCSVIAKELARQGMQVALLGRTMHKLEAVAEGIRGAGGIALPIAVDVTHLGAVKDAAQEVYSDLGPCMVLVNGAGGKVPGTVTEQAAFAPEELDQDSEVLGFFNCDLEAFRREVDLNLCGTVIPSQAFGRAMAVHGGGSIVNFASMASFRPLSRVAPYVAAKSAIVSFTQWLAAYLAPAHIRVNAIAPGFFLNERSRRLLLDDEGCPRPRGEQVLHHTPFGRFGEPEELLGCLNWLIDDRAAGFVTGVTVPVDGGFLACPGT
jgi:NAD(P)-dependent dehydrogenase (short-subunit alcohol dehydrogenase family)